MRNQGELQVGQIVLDQQEKSFRIMKITKHPKSKNLIVQCERVGDDSGIAYFKRPESLTIVSESA